MAGLKNKIQKIKTMTNNVNVKLTPHKACLNVASLELEKQRHSQELAGLLRRVAELNTRLQQIAKEQDRLAKLFLDTGNANEPALLTLNNKERKPIGQEGNSSNFKIRY